MQKCLFDSDDVCTDLHRAALIGLRVEFVDRSTEDFHAKDRIGVVEALEQCRVSTVVEW